MGLEEGCPCVLMLALSPAHRGLGDRARLAGAPHPEPGAGAASQTLARESKVGPVDSAQAGQAFLSPPSMQVRIGHGGALEGDPRGASQKLGSA